jgi:hypothetical protein
LPVGKLVKVGAWENGKFIGVVIFGRGAAPSLGKPYSLGQDECVELVRVALTNHTVSVSRINSLAIKFLCKENPKIRLIVSFADCGQNHHGGIYQAGNWLYSGFIGSTKHKYFMINGQKFHGKSLHSKYGIGGQRLDWLKKNIDPNAKYAPHFNKHRYLMPLDAEIRERIMPLSKPYPKRAKDQDLADHAKLGGETPTRTLQSSTGAK